MAESTSSFKNVYLVDMKKLNKQPIDWTAHGILLPIETINGNAITDNPKFTKLFAERPAKRMIEQYPILFPMLNRDARTIIEYIAGDGHALITLYPNADLDIHDQNWQEHLNRIALDDLRTTYNKRKKAFEGLRGAVHAFLSK